MLLVFDEYVIYIYSSQWRRNLNIRRRNGNIFANFHQPELPEVKKKRPDFFPVFFFYP